MMQKWRNESFIDVANLILGAWLFLSPWIFGYAVAAEGVAWNAWIVGAVIFLVAVAALSAFAEWEEWVNLIFGLWAIISPWVVGFSANTTATRVHVIVGIIVAVLSAVDLWLIHHTPPRLTATP